MLIRAEKPEDYLAIASVVEDAFGQGAEAPLVEQLRKGGDAIVSLVAVLDGEITGHVMLSRMSAPFRAVGLAPLAVASNHQNQGIGSALVTTAVQQARVLGCEAIFVVGDPAYYTRFGFRADLAAQFSSPYAGEHFMVLPLTNELSAKTGDVSYAKAFAAIA